MRLQTTIAAFAMTAVGGAVATTTAVHEPRNPCTSDEAIVVSVEGLFAFDADGLEPTWSAFEGLRTREPVLTAEGLLVSTSHGAFLLDEETGEEIWRLPLGDRLFAPVVHASSAYFGARDGRLRSVDVGTGSPAWERRLPGWVYAPAVLGDVLVTGGREGRAWGLAREDGAVLWERELAGELVHRPVAAGETAILTTYGGTITAVHAADGTEAWSRRTPVPAFTPLVLEDLLVFGRFDGLVDALEPEDGRLRWSVRLGAPVSLPPVAWGTRVVLADAEGLVVVVDAETGDEAWRSRVEGALIAAPVPAPEGGLLALTGGSGMRPRPSVLRSPDP